MIEDKIDRDRGRAGWPPQAGRGRRRRFLDREAAGGHRVRCRCERKTRGALGQRDELTVRNRSRAIVEIQRATGDTRDLEVRHEPRVQPVRGDHQTGCGLRVVGRRGVRHGGLIEDKVHRDRNIRRRCLIGCRIGVGDTQQVRPAIFRSRRITQRCQVRVQRRQGTCQGERTRIVSSESQPGGRSQRENAVLYRQRYLFCRAASIRDTDSIRTCEGETAPDTNACR